MEEPLDVAEEDMSHFGSKSEGNYQNKPKMSRRMWPIMITCNIFQNAAET